MGCAKTAQETARAAAPAAVNATVKEARKRGNRERIAEVLSDPQIREATRKLTESVVSGAFDSLTDRERAERLGRLTDTIVANVTASIARSWRTQLMPEIAATFATTVDQSVSRALNEDTERRLQALASAVTEGTLNGIANATAAPNGQPSPRLSAAVGNLVRGITHEAAFGLQDAVRESASLKANGQVRRGNVLALAAQAADIAPWTVPVVAALLLTGLGVLGGIAWIIVAFLHQRRANARNEQAAVALARAIESAQSAPWGDDMRERLRQATRDSRATDAVDDLLRHHQELRLHVEPPSSRSSRPPPQAA